MMTQEDIHTEICADCLLCGRGGVSLYQGLGDRLYSTPGQYGFLKCPECSFVWLSPRPAPEEMWQCYPVDYVAYQPPRESVLGGRSGAQLRDAIRALILSEAFGYTKFSQHKWWAPPLGRALALIPPLRKRATFGWHELCPEYIPDGLLLDVGCGSGTYLYRMRELGWEVLGVDPAREAAKSARESYGITVQVGTLEEMKFQDAAFAVVTMTHVIEHVSNPLAYLKECYRILRPGGRLIVTTPNLCGLGSRVFKQSWLGLDPPRHLSLFLPATLRLCVERAGFTIERLRSRAYNAASIFDLSLSISRQGHVDDYPSVRKVKRLAGGLAYLERTLLLVWRWAGNELMITAIKR